MHTHTYCTGVHTHEPRTHLNSADLPSTLGGAGAGAGGGGGGAAGAGPGAGPGAAAVLAGFTLARACEGAAVAVAVPATDHSNVSV